MFLFSQFCYHHVCYSCCHYGSQHLLPRVLERSSSPLFEESLGARQLADFGEEAPKLANQDIVFCRNPMGHVGRAWRTLFHGCSSNAMLTRNGLSMMLRHERRGRRQKWRVRCGRKQVPELPDMVTPKFEYVNEYLPFHMWTPRLNFATFVAILEALLLQ